MYVASTRALPAADPAEIVVAVREAATLAEAAAALGAATRWLGFDRFVLVVRSAGRAPVRLSDYPARWFDRCCALGVCDGDPVMLAAAQSVAPFWWHELPTLLALSPQQHGHRAVAAARGLTHGYSVPVHLPAGGLGVCSFAGDGDPSVGDRNPGDRLLDQPATAHHLACLAVDTVRRLTAGDAATMPGASATTPAEVAAAANAPRLTPRQLDCVVLAARGKSNWVAGQLLGLSSDTVHKYIENAKRRYGVSSRTELVVRALHDGHLSFADVFTPDRSGAERRSPAAAS